MGNILCSDKKTHISAIDNYDDLYINSKSDPCTYRMTCHEKHRSDSIGGTMNKYRDDDLNEQECRHYKFRIIWTAMNEAWDSLKKEFTTVSRTRVKTIVYYFLNDYVNELIVIAYILRFVKHNKTFGALDPAYVLLVLYQLTAKYYEEQSYGNRYIARKMSMDLRVLNETEKHILCQFDYRCNLYDYEYEDAMTLFKYAYMDDL